MEITRVFMCELPFILNLPNGTYDVPLPTGTMTLELFNGWSALHADSGRFAVGPLEHLRASFPEFEQRYRQPLPTVLRHHMTVEVPDDHLPVVGEAELLEDISAEVVGELMGAGGPAAAVAEARRRLDAMPADERERRCARGAALRHGSSKMRPTHEEFLAAANVLIRLYMERFKDPFVEAISIDHIAAQAPMSGVFRQIIVGGELVDGRGIVGAIPPLMRRAWYVHPADQIQKFRSDLTAGVTTDSVGLLGIRARAFLLRGPNRSAIVEASAALDLAVSRKIRVGLRLKGKIDAEIDVMLRMPSNQRFDGRAKKILREATGQSAADFDNSLWSDVVAHRTTHRQGASHSDAEPSGAEAKKVVDDFLRLAELVDGMTPK